MVERTVPLASVSAQHDRLRLPKFHHLVCKGTLLPGERRVLRVFAFASLLVPETEHKDDLVSRLRQGQRRFFLEWLCAG